MLGRDRNTSGRVVMTDIIKLFERLGQDAQLRQLSGADLEQALVEANVDAGVRAAILRDDRQQLASLLGVPASSCCLIEDPEGAGEPARENA
jgi:hypothetical protein